MKWILIYESNKILLTCEVSTNTIPYCMPPTNYAEFDTEAEMLQYIEGNKLVEANNETI